MNDELERLRAALKSAPPVPDPDRRAQTLARAMAAFDRETGATQGNGDALRPISDPPRGAGGWNGVIAMLSRLSLRPALAATASAAALVAGVVILLPHANLPRPGLPGPASQGTASQGTGQAPVAARVDAPKPLATPEATPTDLLQGAPTAEPLPADARKTGPVDAAPAAPELAPAPAPAPLPDRELAVAPPPQTGAQIGAQIGAQTEDPAEAIFEALTGAMADADMDRARLAAPTASVAGKVAAESHAADMAMSDAQGLAEPVMASVPTSDYVAPSLPGTEAFANAKANGVKVAAEEPVSTFSVDVDTASYSVLRSSLNAGQLPPPESVRIEEMVNYFPYAYPAPDSSGPPILPHVAVTTTPWNPDTLVLRIGLQGRALAARPPLDLVFLIDTSGSMEDPDKLPLLRQAFSLMLGRLAPEDRVAIVTYAGSAGLVLEPTAASDRTAILEALDRLSAGGSTAGQEGLQQAYATAEAMRRDGSVRRVILATDGDFNVGISDPAALETYIAGKRDSGTYLSVLGFGRGNLDDATMQALAQNGNGQAAYIDTLSEAQKVLADQLAGALVPIADDVKVQVELNPAKVAEYRLIGYETRALDREDFTNDRVDAGEVGAGLQVTALYEVTPVGSPALRNPPLRYEAGAAPDAERPAPAHPEELGFLKMRWKEPGADRSQEISMPIPAAAGPADADTRFAAAIAGMGQLLRHEPYLGDWGWPQAIALAEGARGEDPFGYRAEAVQLMRLAESLSR